MKFSVNQSEFNNALSVVLKGSSNKSTLSILAGILIQTKDNEVVLQTTDLEISIKMTLPALIEESGETVVPAKLFTDIIKNLPDQAVSIISQESTVTVLCNNITYSLKALNSQDFPAFPEITPDQEVAFPFKLFASMVKSTAKTVSRDESRPILTGVLISQIDKTLKLVATDSYRLALAETELSKTTPSEFEVVISGSFLNDIASLPQTDEEITLAISDNQIIINYQNVTFINRRIEGNFPNYKQLISDSYSTRVKVSRSQLHDAVRRVSLLSSKVSPVQISVDAEAGVMTLITSMQDVGNAQEIVTCQAEGESVQIAFNYQFLQEGISVLKSDLVLFDFFGSMKPGVLRTENQDFLYLIMPVRF